MAVPGPEGLWEYAKTLPERLREQFLAGMGAFAETRQPAHLAGALNPLSPLMQDAAVQAGGLLAPQVNALSQTISQGSENLGLGPLSIPEVTDEQLAPLLMLGMGGRGGMGGPNKMGFYSPSGKALTTAPGKGQPGQYLAHLKKEPGATKEAKETGLLQALEQAPGTLTKEEVVSMWNPIELDETVKGDLSSAREVNLDSPYAIPEVLNIGRIANDNPGDLELTLVNDSDTYQALESQFPDLMEKEDWGEIVVNSVFGGESKPSDLVKYAHQESLNLPGGSNAKEILVQLPVGGSIEAKRQADAGVFANMSPGDYPAPFTGGHWSEPNVLAHIRTNERDVGGVKALHIEEIQSDWHQAGQKKGYVDEDRKRVLEGRISEITKAMKVSNNRISGDDNVGLLKKLDGDTSGLNVMISRHPEGGINFSDRNQKGDDRTTNYAFIGSINREGNLYLTKYATPEQKILLEKHAELVKESNSNKNELNEVNSVGSVPDAPYKKDWHELAFKRALMEGINDPSIERLTWTTGDVQKERYNLARYINSIEAQAVGDNFNLAVIHKDGHAQNLRNVTPDELADHVGKEMAEKIVSQKGGMYSGLDLEVGGEFHKQLYDGKITKFAQKFLKKYGVEPQRIKPGGAWEVFDPKTGKATNYFSTEAEAERFVDDWNERIPGSIRDYDQSKGDFWSIDITPEMRQDLQQKGVPLTMNDKKPLLAYA